MRFEELTEIKGLKVKSDWRPIYNLIHFVC